MKQLRSIARKKRPRIASGTFCRPLCAHIFGILKQKSPSRVTQRGSVACKEVWWICRNHLCKYYRSNSLTWQISESASYTPTVKNLSRGTSISRKGKAPVHWSLTQSLLYYRYNRPIRIWKSKKPPRFPKEALSHYFSFSSHTAIPTELYDS